MLCCISLCCEIAYYENAAVLRRCCIVKVLCCVCFAVIVVKMLCCVGVALCQCCIVSVLHCVGVASCRICMAK